MSYNTNIINSKIKKLPKEIINALNELNRTETTEEEIIYKALLIAKYSTETDEEMLSRLLSELQYFSLVTTKPIEKIITAIGILLAETNDRLLNSIEYIINNCNIISSIASKYDEDIKKLQSHLNTIKLMSNIKSEWSMQINDLSDITSIKLVQIADQLEFDLSKYVITLPVDSTTIVNNIENIEVASGSNGVNGNNKIPGAAKNADITNIIDNNQTTMFEYETYNTNDLIFNIKITLAESQIINKISIIPIIYATKQQPILTNVKIGDENNNFENIYCDSKFPINLTISSDDNTKSKILYLYPVNAKTIILSFIQKSDYPIIDRFGNIKLRKVIGIKDIILFSNIYKKTGKIQLRNFYPSQPLTQLAYNIKSNFEEYADITISSKINNSDTPYVLAPLGEDINLPKILHINDAGYGDTIEIEENATIISPELIIKRKNLNFPLSPTENIINEFVDIPTATPYEISIKYKPAENSFVLSSPNYIGVGKGRRAIIGNGSGEDSQLFDIPIDINKSSILRIFANNIEYFESTDITSAIASSHKYTINRETGTILFSKTFSANVPSSGSVVTMEIEKEKPTIEHSITTTRVITNNIPSDYIQKKEDEIELYNILEQEIITTKCIFNGKTSFIEKYPIINGSTIVTLEGYDYIDFINGIVEFSTNNQFTIDKINKKVYLSTNFVGELQIQYTTYKTQQIDIISKEKNIITVNTASIMEFNSQTINMSLQEGMIQLPHSQIVTNTIVFSTAGDHAGEINNENELPYIDGITEFNIYKNIVEEIPNNKKEFILSYMPNDTQEIIFSDNIVFAVRVYKEEDLNRYGSYLIIYDNVRNRTIIKTNRKTRGGTIAYKVKITSINPENAFSVDYKNGIIYFGQKLDNTNITLNYKYNNIEIRYVVARIVPRESYEIVKNAQSIRFTSLDTIKSIANWPMPLLATYNTSVDNEKTIQKLEKYITPIIKEVDLKWI